MREGAAAPGAPARVGHTADRRVDVLTPAEQALANLSRGAGYRGRPEHGAGGVQLLRRVKVEPISRGLLLTGEVVLDGVPARSTERTGSCRYGPDQVNTDVLGRYQGCRV